MALKHLLLVLIVSASDAVFILFGSFMGHSVHSLGLFAGATLGGIVGVGAAVWLAARLRLVERGSYAATFVGGLIGFVAAALVAVKNLRGPVIPMVAVGLVGLGALVGKIASQKRTA